MDVDTPVRPTNAVRSAAPPGGMALLLQVVQELSLARDLPTVQEIVRHAARRLTGCDGATFVLRDESRCFYADEDAIEPLWKGMRFPLEACISGWAMLNRQAAVIPDIYADARIPHEAYRPTFVKSLVMVPIRTRDPIGAIGNYWACERVPTAEEVQLLQALADCTSIAMENVQVYQSLERRVDERTSELQQAYDEIHRLSLTDELTGLNNRRGFQLLAEQALRQATRLGIGSSLMFVDLDGLKRVNDEFGHEAGDALLVEAASVLRHTFRGSDIVARLGGDEFCVLVLDTHAHDRVDQRLQHAIERFNAEGRRPYMLSASTGVVHHAAGERVALDELTAAADALMYEHKRNKASRFGAVA
ncbi:MAG: sensor domain-containing diguanylate cyclase [Paucibacter sp.]|nr:sensor domain-containing diguanylate cyclase [Roseateles sp.]